MSNKRQVSLRSLRSRSLLIIVLLFFYPFFTLCLLTLFVDCINHLPQPVASKDEKAAVPPISVDSNAIDLPSEGQTQAGTSNMDGGHNGAHNFYASQAQPFYYQGQLACLFTQWRSQDLQLGWSIVNVFNHYKYSMSLHQYINYQMQLR